MERVVKKLINDNKTISTMESCTGGGIANAITNIPDASKVIKFSAVTYSNEYKIKMGVSKDIIDTYTVYSMETAKAMSKAISEFTNSDYGVGVTGQINRVDPANIVGNSNQIYVSVYDKEKERYYTRILTALDAERKANKDYIVDVVRDIIENEIFKIKIYRKQFQL